MDDLMQQQLAQEELTPFHDQMLKDCKAQVLISRRKMNEYYETWDKNDDTYRCIITKDKDDQAAADRKEPVKMVVPISFAQIQTFVSFCHALYTQKDRIFELEGFTPEDDKPSKIGEALLARDLAKNKFDVVLTQWLLDIAKFGIGVLKCHWVTEKQMVRKTVEIPPKKFLGVTLSAASTQETTEWTTSYEGNRILNISPYHFFPDVRLPLTRMQEGEFCASEELYSFTQLKKWENEGVVAGVDFVRPISKQIEQERSHRWNNDLEPTGSLQEGAGIRTDGQMRKTFIVTEVQREIIPSKYLVEGKPIGPEDYPVKYVIWIANDNRVIKCEPMNYLHNEYTYVIGQYSNDNNVLLSTGLSEVIDSLQSVISWFINSRVTNVRKIIGDKLIVNTTAVNMKDIQNRSPVIRLTASATGEIDRYIKQLQLQDVTVKHIDDVKALHEILKMVTGITDSLLGEVRPGRRSATENRNSTTGAANRLRTVAVTLFSSGLAPLSRQMLSNLRDGLEVETYVKVMGMKGQATPEFLQIDKTSLVGHYDFEVFDGTLPSDRIYIAQAIEELVAKLGPMGLQQIGLSFKRMIFEAMLLRGIKNPERFELTPEELQQIQMQMAMSAAAQPATSTGKTPPNGKPVNGNGKPNGQQPTTPPAGGPAGAAPGVSPALPESILRLLTAGVEGGGAVGGSAGIPGM